MNASRAIRFAVKAVTVDPGSDTDSPGTEWGISKRDYMLGDVLARAMSSPIEFAPALDGEFGRRLPDGNWTGALGLVVRGLADIALLSPTEDRLQAANFSYPYYFDQVTFITKKPEAVKKPFAFLYPFSRDVWCILIATIFAVSVLIHIILRRRYQYHVVVLSMLQSLVLQFWSIKTVGGVEKLAQLAWFVGAMLLAQFYTAVLLSSYSFPTLAGIKTIPDLSKAVVKGTHQCKTYPGTYISYQIAESEDEAIGIIGRSLLKNQQGPGDVISVLQMKGMVFVGTKNDNEILSSQYFISEDNFFQLISAPAYRKNFCCVKKLETAILRATAAGLFLKVESDTAFFDFFKEIINIKDIEENKVLTH